MPITCVIFFLNLYRFKHFAIQNELPSWYNIDDHYFTNKTFFYYIPYEMHVWGIVAHVKETVFVNLKHYMLRVTENFFIP